MNQLEIDFSSDNTKAVYAFAGLLHSLSHIDGIIKGIKMCDNDGHIKSMDYAGVVLKANQNIMFALGVEPNRVVSPNDLEDHLKICQTMYGNLCRTLYGNDLKAREDLFLLLHILENVK